MPQGERTSVFIAGAVLGVLGILVTLFALVGQMDNRYPTRLEYVATMQH